jgi:CTD small phosphatase-like protein 2
LGRDLSRTIIIDNVYENFQLQPDNAIFIKTWKGDIEDTSLFDLVPFLKGIVVKKVPDVRNVLRKIRDSLIRLYMKGDTNPFETLKKYFNN